MTRYASLLIGESLHLGLSDGGVTDFFQIFKSVDIICTHVSRDKTRMLDDILTFSLTIIIHVEKSKKKYLFIFYIFNSNYKQYILIVITISFFRFLNKTVDY